MLLALAQGLLGQFALGDVVHRQQNHLEMIDAAAPEHQAPAPCAVENPARTSKSGNELPPWRRPSSESRSPGRSQTTARQRIDDLSLGFQWRQSETSGKRPRFAILIRNSSVQHQQRLADGFYDRHREVARLRERCVLGLQFIVDGDQLFVGGLQLFLGGLQFLVEALQLLIGRERLLGRVLALFPGCLMRFDCGKKPLLGVRELLFQP